MLRDKDDHGQAIGGAAEDGLQSIHFVNIGHPECREHGKQNESHASAEIASIDSNYKLEGGRRDDCFCARVMTNPGSTAGSSQFASEDEEQSRYKHEPRQNSQKGLGRSSEQEQRTQRAPGDRSAGQRDQYVPPDIQVVPESSAAECEAYPERESIRRIRGNRRDASKKQSWKCNEAAATGNRVERAAEYRSKEQENSISKAEVRSTQALRNVSELERN